MSPNTISARKTPVEQQMVEIKPLVTDDRKLSSTALSPTDPVNSIETFEDVLQALNPAGIWQKAVVGAAIGILVLVGIAIYGQPLLMMGNMDHACYIYEDGTSGAQVMQPNMTESAKKLAACTSPTTGSRCVAWNYSSPYYESTMVSEWNLVCSRAYLRSLYQSIMLLGYLIGLSVFGLVSDTVGRARLIRWTWPVSMLHIAMTCFAPSYWVALSAKLLHGFLNAGYWKGSFVLGMELMTPNQRSSAAATICTSWPVAALCVAVIGYFFRNWRILQRVVAVIALTSFPLVLWLPESPRWLISQGKFVRARKILTQAARWNRSSLMVEDLNLKALHNIGDNSHSPLLTGFRSLFATRKLRQRTLILFVQWFIIALVNYGVLFYGIGVLPGNPYFTLGLMSILRIVLLPVQFWVFKTAGHRGALFVWLWATAVGLAGLGMCTLFPLENVMISQTIGIVLVSAAAASGDCCFSAIYNLTGELYPTVSRQTGMSACSMIGRFGGFSAPYVANMVGDYYRPLPAFIFCGLSILSSLPIFMLPRMEHVGLPETLQDTAVKVAKASAT